MYTLELGVFMYKYHITGLPVAFNNYFKKRSEIHDYPTRQVNDLALSLNKKNCFLIMLFEQVDHIYGILFKPVEANT